MSTIARSPPGSFIWATIADYGTAIFARQRQFLGFGFRRSAIQSRIVGYGTVHFPEFHLRGPGRSARRVEKLAGGDGIPGLGVGSPRLSRRFQPARSGQLPAQRRARGPVCADRQRPLRIGVRRKVLRQASAGGRSEALGQRDLVRVPARTRVWEAHAYSGARADLGPTERISSGSEERDGSERDRTLRRAIRLLGFCLQSAEGQLDSPIRRLHRG